ITRDSALLGIRIGQAVGGLTAKPDRRHFPSPVEWQGIERAREKRQVEPGGGVNSKHEVVCRLFAQPYLVAQRGLVEVHDREPEFGVGKQVHLTAGADESFGSELKQVVLFVLDLYVRSRQQRLGVTNDDIAGNIIDRVVRIGIQLAPVQQNVHASF